MRFKDIKPQVKTLKIKDIEMETTASGRIILIIRLAKSITVTGSLGHIITTDKIYVVNDTVDEAGDNLRVFLDEMVVKYRFPVQMDVSRSQVRVRQGMLHEVSQCKLWFTLTKFTQVLQLNREQRIKR